MEILSSCIPHNLQTVVTYSHLHSIICTNLPTLVLYNFDDDDDDNVYLHCLLFPFLRVFPSSLIRTHYKISKMIKRNPEMFVCFLARMKRKDIDQLH